MPFTKETAAKLGKQGGKASGQKKRDWNSIGEYLLTNGSEKFLYEIDQLEGKEYAQAFKEILEYFKPKLARTESDITSGGEKLQISPVQYAPNNNSA